MSNPSQSKSVSALDERTHFGFWLYLMTDCVLFATLFATYAVLHNNTNGGPAASDLFSLPYVLVQTLILLTSSLTAGLATLAAARQKIRQLLAWLVVTGLLGASFLALELHEFRHLVQEGHGWQQSAFLSSYFSLVGTHGLHIAAGLVWLVVLVAMLSKRGLTAGLSRKVGLFGAFWHFLDIVWIFIFTFVYLLGVAAT